jgi:hypothetical protein
VLKSVVEVAVVSCMVIRYPLSVSVTSVFRLHVIPICASSLSGYHFVLCVPKQRRADTPLPLLSAGLSTFRKTGVRFTAQKTRSAHEHRKKTRPATLQKQLPLCPHSFSFLPTSTLTRAHSLLTRFQASVVQGGEAARVSRVGGRQQKEQTQRRHGPQENYSQSHTGANAFPPLPSSFSVILLPAPS